MMGAMLQDEPTSPAAGPRRRSLQFSLRTLLILVAVLSALSGWVGLQIRRAERQRAIVASIQKAGGSVRYDFETDPTGQSAVPGAQPTGPWYRKVIGDDYFASIT